MSERTTTASSRFTGRRAGRGRFRRAAAAVLAAAFALLVPGSVHAAAADYPYASWDPTVHPADPYGWGTRQCVSFVAWRLADLGELKAELTPTGWVGPNGTTTSWGNASTWAQAAAAVGYQVGTIPQVGAVAQWDANVSTTSPSPGGGTTTLTAGPAGHVGIVTRVLGSNLVEVEGYNQTQTTELAYSKILVAAQHYLYIGVPVPTTAPAPYRDPTTTAPKPAPAPAPISTAPTGTSPTTAPPAPAPPAGVAPAPSGPTTVLTAPVDAGSSVQVPGALGQPAAAAAAAGTAGTVGSGAGATAAGTAAGSGTGPVDSQVSAVSALFAAQQAAATPSAAPSAPAALPVRRVIAAPAPAAAGAGPGALTVLGAILAVALVAGLGALWWVRRSPGGA